MLHIVGTITPTSHVHQTAPDRDGNENSTIKTRVFGVDKSQHVIPFITANSIRGLLRRAAAKRVLDALGAPVSRSMFSVLTAGKGSRTEIGMQAPVNVMSAASKSIFAGLFGGGAYMHPSRYKMGPLFPMVEWCERFLHPSLRDSGEMIPLDRLRYRTEDGTFRDIALTTRIILTSKDDVMAGKGAEYIKDYETSLGSWLSAVKEGRVAKAEQTAAKDAAKKRGEKVDAEKEAKSVDISGFNIIEAILPGTPLQFWMRIEPTTPAQVGLMLTAVRDWANANVIGGASSRGFGRFEARLALYDGEQLVAPSLFGLSDHATAYTLADDVDVYVKAAEDALQALTTADLDLVYPTGADAAKKGKKGKGDSGDGAGDDA